MNSDVRRLAGGALLPVLTLMLIGCSPRASDSDPDVRGVSAGAGATGMASPATRTLILGAYTTPREVYSKAIIPAFQRHWKAKTGEDVRFEQSYLGSGAQARAIIGGFEADIAALSLEIDLEKIARAGLISHNWRAGRNHGMVSRSIVVIAVRKGNPKRIQDWADLARPGIEVLTPNARTSGGAMWNIAAIYGAATRGRIAATEHTPAGAEALLAAILRNVKIMDKGARESIVTFENGVGDAAITYENEVLVGQKAGRSYDYVVPGSTILIENPVAVVDAYVEKHGTRQVAEAFVEFLSSQEAQREYAEYGLRPVDEAVAIQAGSRFPGVTDLFTVRDLGGWAALDRTLFGPGAVYDRAVSVQPAR